MGGNACDDAFAWADREPGRVLFAVQADSAWRPVLAAEFASRVRTVAAGLLATGISPGDRVGLIGATSLDWLVCDFSIWAAGAVTVPIYETSSIEQIHWQLSDSGAVAVFAGNEQLAEAVRASKPAKVKAIWRMEAGDLDGLVSAGQSVATEKVASRRAAVTAETLATIVYTSGTTGRSKGCMISHGNLTEAVRVIVAAPGVREQILAGDSSSLAFLPLSHVLARVVMLCLVHAGKRVGLLPNPDELPRALATFRPTILVTVPRMLEKAADAARLRAEAERRRRLFDAAEATAMAWSMSGKQAGLGLRLRHAAFEPLVYARRRAGLGGDVAWLISGGAPLNEDLAHFWRGAGITVMEGWGLTESSGPVTMNPPAVQRIGSVGLPLPGCAIRVAPNGEIEVRGPNVFQGYWQDAEATQETFDGAWLRTGDLGRVDDEGFVYVTGRMKEVLITAGGKHVVPSVLEDQVRQHWLIAECVVVGDRRPYVGALVTLSRDGFARWKQRQGKPASATVSDLQEDPDLLEVVRQAVDRANAAVSRPERIKRFRIVPGQFEVGAELTPTEKVRHAYVLARYASDIDALYA